MNPFFVSSGPEDPGDPDRPGRPHPDPAEGMGTAAPADRTDRRPRRPDGADPAGDRLRRRPAAAEPILGSAMRYRPEQQRVESGGTLLLEVSESHGEGLSPSGDSALLLSPGQYLCAFAADAEGERDCGAVFAVNGVTLPYTAARLPGGEAGRLSLTAVLDLTAAALLSVENNCAGQVTYRNPVLTAVRLS